MSVYKLRTQNDNDMPNIAILSSNTIQRVDGEYLNVGNMDEEAVILEKVLT